MLDVLAQSIAIENLRGTLGEALYTLPLSCGTFLGGLVLVPRTMYYHY